MQILFFNNNLAPGSYFMSISAFNRAFPPEYSNTTKLKTYEEQKNRMWRVYKDS